MVADKDEDDDKTNDFLTRTCKEKGYDLVWMNIDIEDVFLDRRIPDKEKVKAANSFQIRASKELSKIGVERFLVPNPLEKRHCSNLFLVLDKYITRMMQPPHHKDD